MNPFTANGVAEPAAFDALIIGAGPAGSAAATWLAQAGWSVAACSA